jgi:hypothetical protein
VAEAPRRQRPEDSGVSLPPPPLQTADVASSERGWGGEQKSLFVSNVFTARTSSNWNSGSKTYWYKRNRKNFCSYILDISTSRNPHDVLQPEHTFYTQNSPDAIAGKVQNSIHFRAVHYWIAKFNYQNSHKLLSVALLGSRPIKVQRHATLKSCCNVVKIHSSDGPSNEDIRHDLSDQSPSKAYGVHGWDTSAAT